MENKEHYNKYCESIEYELKKVCSENVYKSFCGIFYSNCVYILFVFIKSTKNTYIMNIQYN